MMRLSRWWLVLALVATPGPADAARVLVFNSTRYVDSNQGSGYPEGSQESDNVQAALLVLGHTVTTIAGPNDPVGTCATDSQGNPLRQPGTVLATGPQYAAALANADVFLLPEQESWCYLAGDLWQPENQPIVTAWRNWIIGGGSLVIHSSKEAKSKVSDLLYRLFTIEPTPVDGINDCQPPTSGDLCTLQPNPAQWSQVRRAAATGTAFETAPPRLRVQPSTGLVTVSSLPAGSKSIYDDGVNSAVAMIPLGSGKVILLGWDWTRSNPPFTDGMDGGWLDVLRAAVVAAATPGMGGGGSGGGGGGGEPDPGPPPTVTLTLNGSSFRPGDVLLASVTAANPGAARLVDVYFGMLLPPAAGPPAGCPGGDAVEVVGAAFSRASTCLTSAPFNMPPLARNIPVAAGMTPTTLANFFGMAWTADRPPGTYVFFMALVAAGAFDDGRIDAGDLLALSTALASVGP